MLVHVPNVFVTTMLRVAKRGSMAEDFLMAMGQVVSWLQAWRRRGRLVGGLLTSMINIITRKRPFVLMTTLETVPTCYALESKKESVIRNLLVLLHEK